MDYPALPTDNLYKFVALAGLALALFSLTYPVSKYIELQLAVIESRFERAKLSIETDDIEHDLKVLEMQKNPAPNDLSAIRERTRLGKLKTVDAEKSAAKMFNQLTWAGVYGVASLVGFLVGSWVALAGFKRWYVRVQRPNDLLLIKQLEKSA